MDLILATNIPYPGYARFGTILWPGIGFWWPTLGHSEAIEKCLISVNLNDAILLGLDYV